jgi:Cytochrome b/b6/petB
VNRGRVRLLSAWVFFVNLLVVSLSGFWLMWFYRPTESLSWTDIQTLHTSVSFGLVVRNVHRRSGILIYLTATLCFVANAVYSSPREALFRKWLRVGVCSSAFVTLFGATVSRLYFPGSGLLFETDQLLNNALRRWYLEHVGPSIVGLVLLLVVASIAIRNWWGTRRGAELPVR